jgi:hypothetical protein
MATTIQQYYDQLATSSIAGVTNALSIPTQINTASLPLKYVRYNGTVFDIATLADTHGLPTHSFDMVVVLEPVGQNTTLANQTLSMTISELIYSFIEDNISCVLTISTEIEINIINTAYWTLVTTVEILGDSN